MGSVIAPLSDAVLGTDMSGKRAASAALGSQQGATNEAKNLTSDQYKYQQGLMSPYQQAGAGAMSKLTSGNLQMDPGYQFRMSEGMKAINNAAASRGMANSGATMKSLIRFGQDTASQGYQQAFNNQMGIANMGFGAANNLGNMSQNYSGNMSNLITNMGNAQANSGLAVNQRQTNQFNQDINGLYSIFGSMAGAGSKA
jgi:hypothetical protein